MKNKSLELLTMAPKAFMKEQQLQRQNQHSMQQPYLPTANDSAKKQKKAATQVANLQSPRST
jgi:hypothetical protein